MKRDTLILAILGLAVSVLAWASWKNGISSGLEAISFVTGALCVWLTVKQNAWNFPLGLLNVATFSVVFFKSHLYADAGLQIVYFALGVHGWYLWLFGGENRSQLTVTRTGQRELALVLLAVVALTFLLWRLLHQFGGSASFWDAHTTALSLGAQWLLNRKKLEAWIFWIWVDVIYIPLYVSKELFLTAVLYAVFLFMASLGYRAWRTSR